MRIDEGSGRRVSPRPAASTQPARSSAPTAPAARKYRTPDGFEYGPPRSTAPQGGTPPPPARASYTVKPGDSYHRIAQNVATQHLESIGLSKAAPEYQATWNRLTGQLVGQLQADNASRPLRPGDTLLLPDPSRYVPRPANAPAAPVVAQPQPQPPSTTTPAAPPSVSLGAASGQVDLGKLTPQQKYDYFQQLVKSQGGTWKTGEGEANIIGVRSFSNDATATAEGNTYNDTIYVVKTVGGQPVVEAYRGSVDAGIHNKESRTFGGDTDRGWGISHLQDGFYEDNWTRGGVPNGGMGLRQAGDVEVNFDTNYDGVITEDERDQRTVSAGWGIQFHTAGNGQSVGTWSAGCQVIVGSQWKDFEASIAASSEAGQQRFSYLLIDSSKLPAPDVTPEQPEWPREVPRGGQHVPR